MGLYVGSIPTAGTKFEEWIIMKTDMYFKIGEEMFKHLVSGKEMIIEQPDGSKLHFALEDIGLGKIIEIITDLADASVKDQQDRLKLKNS